MQDSGAHEERAGGLAAQGQVEGGQHAAGRLRERDLSAHWTQVWRVSEQEAVSGGEKVVHPALITKEEKSLNSDTKIDYLFSVIVFML